MMSSSVPTIDTTQKEEPAPLDGWRTGGLAALRGELDRIDNKIHDLLMERAGVVEYVARSGKPAAFRPGREASIIRRLLRRHKGALPLVSIARIWRELLAGTTAMQGGFSLATFETDQGAAVTQLAREHFGALTPLRSYPSAGQALMDVSQGGSSVAVLPYPSEDDNWWVALLHHEPRLHIVGRLPFWDPRPEGAPAAHAIVVASTPSDASEQDRSFVGLECDSDISRDRLSSELSGLGLKPEILVLARRPGSPIANLLVEVDGYLADDDPRLVHLGPVLRQPIVLGSYAAPVGEPGQ
jgi:chorismate mutase/prephenate dehydratase